MDVQQLSWADTGQCNIHVPRIIADTSFQCHYQYPVFSIITLSPVGKISNKHTWLNPDNEDHFPKVPNVRAVSEGSRSTLSYTPQTSMDYGTLLCLGEHTSCYLGWSPEYCFYLKKALKLWVKFWHPTTWSWFKFLPHIYLEMGVKLNIINKNIFSIKHHRWTIINIDKQ